MRIIRVFCRKTSYTPTDDMAFVGPPPGLFIPEHDEIHISCTFTWDMDYAEELAFQWEGVTNKPVKLGGPAYHSAADDFTPGMYVRKGIIFTSRGCNNNCPWCGVRQIEGTLRELPITPGNIIQDNNFLQCSRQHKDKVFDMLRTQRGIAFRGGAGDRPDRRPFRGCDTEPENSRTVAGLRYGRTASKVQESLRETDSGRIQQGSNPMLQPYRA